jgi:assimilatory nitrate reductase catalytic subunit
MEAAKARGQRHIVLDPRRTDTADGADLHLPIAPQSDVRLWNGLLAHLIRVDAIERAYIRAHVTGFDEAIRALAADDQSPRAVAVDCGVEEADLMRFFAMFAEAPRTVTLFSMGANQSAQGVAKGLAIINAHLATGRIGKPGACPFSITGQPNAMGGREVGGMATVLAAHMGFDDASCDRVARFWAAPNIARKAGLKAVDMFDAVHDGRIKAIWIMATNPAVSMPNSGRVREALARCPLVIVSDCMADTDTMTFAHVKLPALAWGEKDGTVTNSERCISRQRPLFPAPGAARADWRIIADVAARLGFSDAFSWRNSAEVFREYARLTAYENDGRLLNLAGPAALSARGYDTLAPVQWPNGQARLFTNGRFATPDGRARMHALAPAGPAEALSARYPLSLNTGRVRDHWHTMTRTALAPHLCRHAPEPFVEIHPHDAAAAGIIDGKLTCVETELGEAVAIAHVTDRQRRGSLFMPMHWTDSFAPEGRANAATSGAVDPQSGQPEFKHTPARLRLYRETWTGFFIARQAYIRPDDQLIWRRLPQTGAHLHEFAGRGDERERDAVRAALLDDARGQCLRVEDRCAASLREAYLEGDRLERVLFFGARLPPRDWLVAAFNDPISEDTRKWLLHGRAPGVDMKVGALVCACAGISARAINFAIASGAHSVEAIGEATHAGVTCGSCRPELRRLIAAAQAAEEQRNAA